MALHLDHPVSGLPGIGPVAAKDLRQLGITTLRDLLLYFPFRYDDFSILRPISSLRHDENVTIIGVIRTIATRPSARNRRLKLTEAIVENETGALKVTWFNQPYLEKTLRPGSRVSLAGRIDARYGTTLMNPVYEPEGHTVHTGRIVPVYGLSGSLTQRRLRSAIKTALPAAREFEEWLPETIVREERFPALADAIAAIHFPDAREGLDAAINRLKFDELFTHQLLFAEIRKDREQKHARTIPIDEAFLKGFVEELPFALTNAQRRAAWEIVQDAAKEVPMNRLLQGDVGSGKTAVAAIAIAHTLAHSGMCAYLAPTEILAGQQATALQRFISDEPVALLTGSRCEIRGEPVPRAELKKELEKGNVRCVVGTHALLQEGMDLPPLAFVVIDEQHRFGVQQRHALLETGDAPAPHLLSMTATPIPRSLALTVYGDLDVSILNERPAGRKPISTHIVLEKERSWMWKQIRLEVGQGRQAYVVCPLIDPSDKLGALSVKQAAEQLSKKELKGISFAVLHGKLKADEKTDILERFRAGTVQVLLSTTVVEVGVDVPNATVMVIYGAERFGLAQLHQLRGRVGRSDLPSRCFLVPESFSTNAQQRLTALVRIHDGFALAEKDLELRGAGNVFGDAQSGFPDFQLATVADVPLMKKARDWATRLFAEDKELLTHPQVRSHVVQSLDRVHLE